MSPIEWRYIPRRTTVTARSRSTAVLITALIVLSTVAAGGTIVGAQTTNVTNGTNTTTETGVELPPADDIYVKDNGDAVLTYESPTPSDGARASYGLDVSKGLFRALVVTDFNETSDAGGNATAILTPESATLNGNLSMPRPEALTNLTVNVTGKRTDENARFDAVASGTATGGNSLVTLVKQARVSGNTTTTPSRFTAATEAHAELAVPLGSPQHREFHIAENNGTYTLNATQNYTVSSFAAQQWSSRQRATQTLRQRYVAAAAALGGTADLTLESYSFTQQREGYRLAIEYTVTYRGIERGLVGQLTTQLAAAEQVDLNQSEIDAIGQRLRNFSVEEASVRYDQGTRSIDAAMAVDLRNYDALVATALDVAESVDMASLSQGAGVGASSMNAGTGMNATTLNATLERLRDRFEARQAANLTSRLNFSANVTTATSGRISFDAESHYRTENWGQFVKELEKRGIKPVNVDYRLHATTAGERVNVTAAVEVSKENLLRGAANWLLNASSGGTGMTGADAANARKYITAFREAGFRKTRMDISIHGGQLRVEAGAAFKNMTALRETFVTMKQGTFKSAVGRTENGTTTSYVRVEGAVSGNVSKSAIRDLAYVNDDTTVHLPDAWNRSMPSANTSQANEYLGLTGGSSGLTGPGFGVVIAVIALLAAALVAARRR